MSSRQPRRAQDMPEEQRAALIEDMTAAIEADQSDKVERARLRSERAAARALMKHISVTVTPGDYEYCKIMAGASGKSISGFVADLIARDAEINNGIFQQVKNAVDSIK